MGVFETALAGMDPIEMEQIQAMGGRIAPFVWPLAPGSRAAECYFCDASSCLIECSDYLELSFCPRIERLGRLWSHGRCLGYGWSCEHGLHLDDDQKNGSPKK